MTPPPPSPAGAHEPWVQRLKDLRQKVLDLHKTLMDYERVTYEQTFGAIKSQNQFLQLLIKDPWFAWLHPISELVVQMDEMLEAKEPLTSALVKRVFAQTRTLLKASEQGQGFGRSYFEALQEEPDVVLAHASVMKCLKLG
jgi:hypothetical protein